MRSPDWKGKLSHESARNNSANLFRTDLTKPFASSGKKDYNKMDNRECCDWSHGKTRARDRSGGLHRWKPGCSFARARASAHSRRRRQAAPGVVSEIRRRRKPDARPESPPKL